MTRPSPPCPSRQGHAVPAANREAAPAFSGAVLAGGASRRFGVDKATYVYRGRSLLEHALASLADAGDLLIVGADAPAGSRATSVADVRPGFGAASGLHAALVHAEHAWVAVTACDMPFVPTRLWKLLLARTTSATDADAPASRVQIVVPEGPRGMEPLAGLYRKDLLPVLEARMDSGGTAVRELLRCAPAEVVPWAEIRAHVGANAFLNANRREDLP